MSSSSLYVLSSSTLIKNHDPVGASVGGEEDDDDDNDNYDGNSMKDEQFPEEDESMDNEDRQYNYNEYKEIKIRYYNETSINERITSIPHHLCNASQHLSGHNNFIRDNKNHVDDDDSSSNE